MGLIRTLLTIALVVIVLGGMGIYMFTDQSIEYDKDLDCEEIRECVALEINCLDKDSNTSLRDKDWEIINRASIFSQKIWYSDNCIVEEEK